MTSPTASTPPAQVWLHRGKEEALRRRHPWVFSGAIKQIVGSPNDGDVVEVFDTRGSYLGTGHFHHGNIAVRVFDYHRATADEHFWAQRLSQAWAVRQRIGLVTAPLTTAFRWVHGEGDGCPGLIIDWYAGVAVLQAHSIGMHRARHQLVAAMRQLLGAALVAVYDKSADTLPPAYAAHFSNSYLWGQAPLPHTVLEAGYRFAIDWQTGQKTGFFLDQRDNRALLGQYAAGHSVLNTFCYSGGFSVYALGSGATRAVSVDASAKAIELTQFNIQANQFPDYLHTGIVADTVQYLRQSESYDIIVLDPPAYAKSLNARHRAVQGYKRLNALGLQRVRPGGLLFTFSCSQVVDRELFYHTVVAAAIESGRTVRVLHHLAQPPDHPVSAFHPEGSYLKGLVLHVE